MSSLSPIGPVDPADPIPAAQLLTIAGTVDRAIASLDPGTLLAASVASVRGGVTTLRVDGQLVQARTETPLSEGERMLLRVDRTDAAGNQIVLRRVDEPAPATGSPLQGSRLTVPAASLSTAVAEIGAPVVQPALPLAQLELPALPALAADPLPLGQPLPATVSGNVLTVSGQELELPAPVQVPAGAPVQATFTAAPGGRVQLTLEPPTPAPASTPAPVSAVASAPRVAASPAPAPATAHLVPGQTFPAITVVSDRGAWLQVGERLLPAEPVAPLPEPALPPAGQTTAAQVTAQVVSVQSRRAEVVLSSPPVAVSGAAGSPAGAAVSAPAAQLAAELEPLLGTQAPAAAALLAVRGAPAGAPETKLAARILAGQEDPVALMRGLAAMFPAIAQQVEAIEQDATAGSGKRLKQTLARIGLDQEAAALRSDNTQAADTLKQAAAPASTLVGAQQLLVAQPPAELATSYFFLPLPQDGKAALAVERSKDALHIRGELSMSAIGDLGFQLTAHEQGVYAQIDAASAAAAGHLDQAAADLRAALEKASGKPAVVTVSHRPPRPVLPALPRMLQEGRLA